MNERAVVVFDKYDLELFSTRKGRGMLIAGTNVGEVALKEYNGSEEKLEWQEAFTNGLKSHGFPYVDGLFRDREGNLIVSDYEGVRYMVKEYLTGRECNVMDQGECIQAVRQIARMHAAIREMMKEPFYIRRKQEMTELYACDAQMEETDGQQPVCQPPVYEKIPVEKVEKLRDITNRTRPGFIRYESAKRKSELVRARQFIRKQPSKNDFDLLFLREFDRFMEQIDRADSYLSEEEYAGLEEEVKKKKLYCHGDCNHHNILFNSGKIYIQNLERCRPDLQVKDLYLFVRKACEKNRWSFPFGKACIDAYGKELPLTKEELKYLYTRFCYPEKFWKIANGYMNHRKSLPPRRQKEKLEALLVMEEGRKYFLNRFQEAYQL